MKYQLNNKGSISSHTQLRRRRNTGQGLTEYVIIVALIAIAAIGAVSFFGSSVKASFLAMGAELVGADNVDTVAATKTNFDKAKADTEATITLDNYRN